MRELTRREQSFPDSAIKIKRYWDYQGSPDDDSLDIRRYFQVLLKRRWLIAGVVAFVLLLVGLQSFTTTPLYRATAGIQINPETANVLPYEEIYESAERYLASDMFLQTQLEILQSKALAQRVVDRLDLVNDPRFDVPVREGVVTTQLGWARRAALGLFSSSGKEETAPNQDTTDVQKRSAIEKLGSRLEVEQVPNSRLVEIRWVAPDPTLASLVADTIAEEFIEQSLQTKFDANARANEFLKKQLEEMKKKVEKSEQELVQYARENNILNINDRGSIVHQTLEDLNAQMTVVEGELITKTAEYEAVKDTTPETFPQVLRTPSIALLEERLFGLQQNLASLSAQFGNEWPTVIQVRQQIEEVQQQLNREKAETIRRAKSDYQVAVNRKRMLERALERQKAQANQLNQDSIQYNILQREVDTNRELYQGLLQRLKETGISAGARTSNIHVVDHAQVPAAPYSPQRARDLAMGLGVGLMIAIGLAFLMEYLDNTVKTPDDMEQSLGLPSLGIIPTISGLPVANSRLLAEKTGSGGGVKTQLPVRSSPSRFRVWEAYRALRTSILLSHSGKPPKVMMITSAIPGEGKTTTVANTGIVLAQTGARTLLIDLDMRKPALAGTFGLKENQGISSYLSGNADLSSQIRQTTYPNLFVLPAGLRPPNPAELIGSERMETALRLLSEYFKYILIDTPPLLSVTDGLLLSVQVDGVVLVIKGGSTSRETVRKASNHLVNVGAHILGGMINNVDIDTPEYTYYYRHYFDERYNTDLSSATGPAGA